MPVALTADLGRFVAALRFQDIPHDARPFIAMGITDCIGTLIAGAGEPAPQVLKKVLSPAGSEATLLFGAERASAPDAALINGTAAHALDFDDCGLRGHPSTVLVPAILAEAEALGASGKQMITAYAAGYEVWAELVRRDPDHQHKKGWHPTAVFGAVAAAAACASLHGLDAAHATTAISMGASQSGGLAANFGTMTKPYHAGRAAQAGVLAARLAAAGYTASPDALEHAPGFLAAISYAGRIDFESPTEAGVDWKLPRLRLSIKKYPLCFASHCALDGIFSLLQQHALDTTQVERVTVTVNRRHATVLRNRAPQTALEAKFSMEFAMACALISRRVTLVELTDDYVRRPDLRALMQRVVVNALDEDPARPGFSADDRVVIEAGGQRYDSGRLLLIRGGPEQPLDRDELWQKFQGCVEVGRAKVPAQQLFDVLMKLEDLPRAAELPGLGGANRPPLRATAGG